MSNDKVAAEAPFAGGIPAPSSAQAEQFCLMLNAGMPSLDAIKYFLAEGEWTAGAVQAVHDKWVNSGAVKKAWAVILGKSWQDLDLDARIQFAIDKHYAELAYFLYSHNFSSVAGADLVKANTARGVLETKLAGLAGRGDALSEFLLDLQKGKVKLGEPLKELPKAVSASGSAREVPTPPKGGGTLDFN